MKSSARVAGRGRSGAFLRAAAAVAFCAAALVGCAKPRPSIVLVSIDSLRADDAAATIGGRPVAPRLAAFAREGTSYERAYAPAPWTTPAMMSILTGLSAPAHGVEEYDRALPSSVATLAERLRAAGYNTAAFVPEGTLRPEFGFGRGFDVYDLEEFGHRRVSTPNLVGKVLARLEAWRKERKPFFIWVHLWDPHFEYIPPPPYDGAFAQGKRPAIPDVGCLKWGTNVLAADELAWERGQYRGEIAFTDHGLGQILDAAGPEAIVAVVGDHGEAFQEHGRLGHTLRVDDEMVRVPLVVRAPGRAASRATAPVSTSRLGPTLLALAGLDARSLGEGATLPAGGEGDGGRAAADQRRDAGEAARGGSAGAATAGAAATAAPIVVETLRQGCFTTIVDGTLKYVVEHRTCGAALYDLAADPLETRDLAAARPADAARLRGALAAELARIAARGVPRAGLPAEVRDETAARLKSLGYLGAAPALDAARAACPYLPQGNGVDGFGDLAVEACPSGGAARCLAR